MDVIEYSEELPSKWPDTLSKITGLTFLICKEDKYHSSQENENPLCKLLQEHTAGRAFCEQDCTGPLVQAIKKEESVFFKCYANLNNVAIPVYINSNSKPGRQNVILGGRIVSSYDDLVGYRGVAERLGCEQNRIIETVKGVPIRDIDKFKTSMDAVKSTTAYLLHKTKLQKDIEEKITKTSTIIKVLCGINAFEDESELYATALNTLGILFDARTAMFLVRDSVRDIFVTKEVFGHGRDLLSGFTVSETKGIIWEAVVRNEVVSSNDLFELLRAGLPNGFRSLKVFPLSVKGGVEGLIMILDTPIMQEDEELIQCFCRTISAPLENRILLLKRETYVKRGIKVLEALQAIGSQIDSTDLFNAIVEKAADVAEAEQGSIMLLEEETKVLEIKATRGLNLAILNYIRINPGEGISGIVYEKGVPLVVSNIESDDRISRQNRIRYKTKSFISLPLKIKDRCIGVLNLSDKANGEYFSDLDLKVLETIALYSAVAIERRAYYQSSLSLRKISITDPVTGLLNRRYFEERIAEEMERSKRHKRPFSLIILDLDNFKEFNDTYGHLAGDEALKDIGHVIRRCIRIIDIGARYGGEEFAIILPTTDKSDAGLIGKRIREEMEKTPFTVKGIGKALKLTGSLGIATFPTDASSVEELINNADRALYKAKEFGKNRVVLFGNF
ncbi:MAG TPA: hypothetical protein DCR39_04615 [Nitrospiraceae bacterium]|nr:hypothetical protein [Nitrospiraceae bacterium]